MSEERWELPGGLVYGPIPPRVRTVDAVREVLQAFGHAGMTSGQVRFVVKRDLRGVQRALGELVEDGEATYTERPTRGKRGTFKRVYRPVAGRPVIERASDRLLYGEQVDSKS